MSYLLSSNNRRRLGLGRLGLGGRSSCIGDAAPQRHPNRPATSAAMGGAGNGLFTNRPVSGQEQVLIQRTSIGQQQQNSQRENPPQQQQRQRTQQQQSLQRLRSQQQEQVPGEVSMQEGKRKRRPRSQGGKRHDSAFLVLNIICRTLTSTGSGRSANFRRAATRIGTQFATRSFSQSATSRSTKRARNQVG